MMGNPWQVQSIEDFACLKCPECVFFCKEEHFFRDHALENHPNSFELFWEEFEEETKTNHMFNDKKIDKENLDVKISTGKSLSESLPFAEHGENMLCTKIVLNIRNNFCTQHVLPRFELGIFMY